jgi:hypothetical protein
MSKTNSHNHHNKAIAYVSDLMSKQDRLDFESELNENDELKTLVIEYKTTLNLSTKTFSFSPSDEKLQSQRLLLKGRIQQLETEYSKPIFPNIGSRIKDFLTAPQPAWAVISYMVIAVLISRTLPLPSFDQKIPIQELGINVVDLMRSNELKNLKLISNLNGDNRIHFALETGKNYDISGGVNDLNIQQLLFYLLLNDENPGKRLKAVTLLKESAPQLDAQSVIVSALLTDTNPGVRLRSIDILQNYESSELIIDASIKVLLEDENEAVRQKALEIISNNPLEKSLPVLQIVSVMDDNEFIRTQAARTLKSFKDSVNPDKIEVK